MRTPLIVAALLFFSCGKNSESPITPDIGVDDVGPDAAVDTAVEPDVFVAALDVSVLSSRADMVTGDDTLLWVVGADGPLTFEVAGVALVAVTSAAPGGTIARLSGLQPGTQTVVISSGGATGAVELTVYPIVGPVFSGPHEDPYFCTTVANELGEPLDEDCSTATVTLYARKKVGGEFELIADPNVPGADTAMTTTYRDGVEVPYVLQVEVGTVNRAIYWIATLHDPDRGQSTPAQRSRTWNGGVVYYFGGGCGTGYTQGDGELVASLNDIAGLGFAWVHASLNTLNNNCNDVLSAETVMMLKEHAALWSIHPPGLHVERSSPDHLAVEHEHELALSLDALRDRYPPKLTSNTAFARGSY